MAGCCAGADMTSPELRLAAVAQARRRKHWGWGYADEEPSLDDVRAAMPLVEAQLGFAAQEPEEAVPLEAAALRAPRALPQPPPGVPWDVSDHARATHAWGKSYLDVVRGFRGRFDHAPDAVARPEDEAQVALVLEWATETGVVVVPYGGGTSVVGGVTPAVDGPVVSLDLGALDRVLEVDPVSRAARVQAGVLGPELEAQLAEHDVTLRHFPQSFELSTLGGWIATRAGGHFATGPTHIDDLVESVRAVTPSGVWESRRLPGSGAGPSPDRALLGSEGILGVITEAWVRVRPKPEHRASRGVRFPSFALGAEAVRALAQSGLQPANCRLIDSTEAALTSAGDGTHALLVLGFESTDAPVEAELARALELSAECGGAWDDPTSARTGAVGAWREAFLRAPYLRDVLVSLGVLSETFETAVTWDAFPALHEAVVAAVRDALEDPRAIVSCRFTHAYADGPAPYFTVLAPARRGDEEAQWWAVKRAAADAILATGGTITHHHAVGRDHRPWYDRQRPEPFALALRAAKAAVDPAGVLNPGVLIDP
jgi:alkyldihydroxyacetonephosphate synthase